MRRGWFLPVAVMAALMGVNLLVVMTQPSIVAAQGPTCPGDFAQVVAEAETRCTAYDSGTVCAAGSGATLTLEEGAVQLITGVSRLEGGAQVVTTDTSVAVLSLPALNSDAGLVGVLFGDATLANAPLPPRAPVCNARSVGSINVRAAPSTEARILGQLPLDQTAPIRARLADASWWQIEWQDDLAWIFADLAPADCDPSTMLVIDPQTGDLSGGLPAEPFQGAQLRSNFSAPICEDMPRAGLLLQSIDPSGASWQLNGLDLTLAGTVLAQASDYDALVLQVLEGALQVRSGDTGRTAQAGEMIRVPQVDGRPEVFPGPATAFQSKDAARSPLSLLSRPVVVSGGGEGVFDSAGEGALSCSPVPQQITAPASGSVATLHVRDTAGEPVRVSVGEGGAVDLAAVRVAGDYELRPIAERVFEAVPLDDTADDLTLELPIDVSGSVALGVTCGLPKPKTDLTPRNCADTLLRWNAVEGGAVRFSGEAGTSVSVSLTVEGSSLSTAGTHSLGVFTEDGELLATAGVRQFVDRLAAGPLTVELPADATYLIRWDGDPYVPVNLEAVCVAAAAGETG